MNLSLNEWSQKAYQASKDKGFHQSKEDNPAKIGQRLMLIVSELAEALEADRKEKYTNKLDHEFISNCDNEKFKSFFEDNIKNTFEDEIADTIIRIFDLCGTMNIDLDSHVKLKMKYNALRVHRHGKKY